MRHCIIVSWHQCNNCLTMNSFVFRHTKALRRTVVSKTCWKPCVDVPKTKAVELVIMTTGWNCVPSGNVKTTSKKYSDNTVPCAAFNILLSSTQTTIKTTTITTTIISQTTLPLRPRPPTILITRHLTEAAITLHLVITHFTRRQRIQILLNRVTCSTTHHQRL